MNCGDLDVRFTYHISLYGRTDLDRRTLMFGTAYGPVLKTTQLSAHAQNHGSLYVAVNLLPPSFSATTISLNRFKF